MEKRPELIESNRKKCFWTIAGFLVLIGLPLWLLLREYEGSIPDKALIGTALFCVMALGLSVLIFDEYAFEITDDGVRGGIFQGRRFFRWADIEGIAVGTAIVEFHSKGQSIKMHPRIFERKDQARLLSILESKLSHLQVVSGQITKRPGSN